MLEKVSIILQRFCYSFGEKVTIEESDIEKMQKILKEISENKDFEGSLFKANLENIIDKIS